MRINYDNQFMAISLNLFMLAKAKKYDNQCVFNVETKLKSLGFYSIKFTATTCFRKIQPLRDSNFLILANFNTILRGLSHPMYCIGMLSISLFRF